MITNRDDCFDVSSATNLWRKEALNSNTAELIIVDHVCKEHSGFAAEIKAISKTQEQMLDELKLIRKGLFGNGSMGIQTRVFILWCGAVALTGVNAVLWAVLINKLYV